MVDDSSSDRDPVEVLAEEFMERLRQGEHPSIAEYKSRYPQLAEDIEDIFPALAMMDEIDPSAGELSQSQPSEDEVLPKLAKLGDYRIIREVGRGGMGVVYEAEQVSLGRHVALKVLPSALLPDSKHVRRFEREAKSAAKLHHTNIVPVFGVGEQDGMHYYVMQFIQGLPLDEVIGELKKIQDQPSGTITSTEPVEKTGPFHRQKSVAEVAHSLMTGQFAETHIADSDSEIDSSAEAQRAQDDDSSASRISETLNLSGSLSGSTLGLGKSGVQSTPQKQFTYWQSVANIGVQVADALQYAHEQAILHRDIKPSNLLLDLRGTTWVTDFGLAKATDQQDITHTGDILGTLRYMPPEAFDGIADARSDVYSLGLTLYELLVFQPAFGVKERHQLIKQVTTESAPRLDKLNPNIPRDLVTIVHKAIDRDPSHRYQTARELEEDLQRFIEDEPIKARRISLAERLARWSRRNKGLAASLATVAALLLIINIVGPWMYLRLRASEADLKVERDEAKTRAEEMEKLAKERDEAAQNEKAAAARATQQEELTVRNHYVDDISRALMLLIAGDIEWFEELLSKTEAKLRNWEYYYLRAAAEDRHLEFRNHPGPVLNVACCPDGERNRFASAGGNGEIHICDLSTGEVRQTLCGSADAVYALGWSPDGERLASGGADKTLRIWDVERGQELLTLRGHYEPIRRLAWDRQGKRVATAGDDGTARIWDAESGKQLAAFHADGLYLYNVAWHPHETWLATVGSDRVVRVWDVSTGKIVEEFAGHTSVAAGLDWHPDGLRLATSSTDGEILIWHTGEQEPVHRIPVHPKYRTYVRFSPDGKSLAVSEGSDSIRILDWETWHETASFRGHPEVQSGLSWSPDSKRLLSGGNDGAVRVWPIENKDESSRIAVGSRLITASDWHPNGRLLAIGETGGVIRILDADTHEVRELENSEDELDYPWAVEFIGDGTQVAATGYNREATGAVGDSVILIWDTDTGKIVQRLQVPPTFGTLMTLSWDGERGRLAAAGRSNRVLIWDSVTNPVPRSLQSSNQYIRSLCFIPGTNGRWLLAAGSHTVWLLDADAEDGAVGTRVAEVPGYIADLAINSDGTRLAVADGSSSGGLSPVSGIGSVRLWDIERNGERIQLQHERLLPGPRITMLSMTFTDDGSRLAVATHDAANRMDSKVYVWDVTGDLTLDVRRQLLVLNSGLGYIRGVQFEPGSMRLAVSGRGGNGGSVQLWDALPGYALELSPDLLPRLQQKLKTRTDTRDDLLLLARIHARRGNWSEAADVIDRLAERGGAARWFDGDIWVLDAPFEGPFPEVLQTEFDPEKKMTHEEQIDVTAPVSVGGTPESPVFAHWQPRPLQKNVAINFGELFQNRGNVAGYALLPVYVPREQQVGIILGAGETHRMWLNGELVDENDQSTTNQSNRIDPDDRAVPVTLKPGWNTLLIKVANQSGAHGFFLSLSDDPEELAPIYERSGHVDAAEEMWDRIVADHPDNPFKLIGRGGFLMSQGRIAEAERDLHQALKLPRIDELTVRLSRARMLFKWGRVDEALADFDRALELAPASPFLLVERCFEKIKLGRMAAAAEDLLNAISLDPADHFRTYQLATLLLEAGDEAEYEKLRPKLIDRCGTDPPPELVERSCKACMLRPADDDLLQRLDELMEVTRNADPNHYLKGYFVVADGMLRYRQGESLLAKGSLGEADRLFEQAEELLTSGMEKVSTSSPTRTVADLFRAMALFRLQRKSEAVDILQPSKSKVLSTRPPSGSYSFKYWHDEMMPLLVYHEAASLILGRPYRELLEGERLLTAGDLDAAVEHLELAITEADAPEETLRAALDLIDKYHVGLQTLLPNSENGDMVHWQYRFTQPAEGWNATGNDEHAGWKIGQSPFGISSNKVVTFRTSWPISNQEIWMRVRFNIDEPPTKPLSLRAYVDDRAEVFINGVLVARSAWVGAKYRPIFLTEEAAQLVRPGENVLAVHCRNVDGPGGIDVGLYVGDGQQVQERLLNAAIAGVPELRAFALRLRGALHVRAGRWKEAAADYAESVYLDPEANGNDWIGVAELYAYADDREGHRIHCLNMRDHFRDSVAPEDAAKTVRAMLLIADSFESELDPEKMPVKALMDSLEGSEITPTNRRWTLSARAWLACRSEKFGGLAKAQGYIDDSKGGPDFSEGGLGLRQRAVQALIWAKQGRSKEEVQQLVHELRSRMEADHWKLWRDDGLLDGETILSGDRINAGFLIDEVLSREAERLIQAETEKAPTSQKKPADTAKP